MLTAWWWRHWVTKAFLRSYDQTNLCGSYERKKWRYIYLHCLKKESVKYINDFFRYFAYNGFRKPWEPLRSRLDSCTCSKVSIQIEKTCIFEFPATKFFNCILNPGIIPEPGVNATKLFSTLMNILSFLSS